MLRCSKIFNIRKSSIKIVFIQLNDKYKLSRIYVFINLKVEVSLNNIYSFEVI